MGKLWKQIELGMFSKMRSEVDLRPRPSISLILVCEFQPLVDELRTCMVHTLLYS
jgi:hypothetical protein